MAWLAKDSSCFSHAWNSNTLLTVQEYLAAYSITQMRPSEISECLSSILSEERFDMVLKFFCGMDRFQSSPSRDVFFQRPATPMIL